MPGLPGFYMQNVCQEYRKRNPDGLERGEGFIKAGFVF